MNLHEINKQRNRQRILAAAEEIIQEQGLESLSMRYLAEFAGVSLRTPYNLFGSKATILSELLIQKLNDLVAPFAETSGKGGVVTMLGMIDGLKTAKPAFSAQLRGLYWFMMTEPEQSLRDTGIQWITALVTPVVEQAIQNGELRSSVDSDRLSRYLVVTLTAIVGMWGAGQLEIDETIEHVVQSWCAMLLVHCNADAGMDKLIAGRLLLSIDKLTS